MIIHAQYKEGDGRKELGGRKDEEVKRRETHKIYKELNQVI